MAAALDELYPTRIDEGESPAALAAAASNAENGRATGELVSARNDARAGSLDVCSPIDNVTAIAVVTPSSSLRRSIRATFDRSPQGLKATLTGSDARTITLAAPAPFTSTMSTQDREILSAQANASRSGKPTEGCSTSSVEIPPVTVIVTGTGEAHRYCDEKDDVGDPVFVEKSTSGSMSVLAGLRVDEMTTAVSVAEVEVCGNNTCDVEPLGELLA